MFLLNMLNCAHPQVTSMFLDVVNNLLSTDSSTLLTATQNANVSAR